MKDRCKGGVRLDERFGERSYLSLDERFGKMMNDRLVGRLSRHLWTFMREVC